MLYCIAFYAFLSQRGNARRSFISEILPKSKKRTFVALLLRPLQQQTIANLVSLSASRESPRERAFASEAENSRCFSVENGQRSRKEG